MPVHGQAGIPLTATEEVELTVPFESESWAVEALVSLGAAVEVLRSADLRARVAGELRAAAARYA